VALRLFWFEPACKPLCLPVRPEGFPGDARHLTWAVLAVAPIGSSEPADIFQPRSDAGLMSWQRVSVKKNAGIVADIKASGCQGRLLISW